MPVLVTAADTDLGRALVRRLLALGGEVRAYCSAGGDIGPLRAAGAITASGTVDDEGRLEAACEQVHTVIHLGGGLLSPSPERIVADASSVIAAATSAGVTRLVALSVVGASVGASDPLRRAKGVVEQMLSEAAVPTVVVRTAIVDVGSLAETISGTPLPGHVRDQMVGVTPADALIDLLVALDELRSTSASGHAVLVAHATRVCTVEALGQRDDATATYRPADQVPLLVPALAGDWSDHDPIAADAWSFAGVKPGAPT